MMIRIMRCEKANNDHKKRQRQYAHTYHRCRGTICVADAFFGLTLNHRMGILSHEIGHLIMGSQDHNEEEADLAFKHKYGIHIFYADSPEGHNLQFLKDADAEIVREKIYLPILLQSKKLLIKNAPIICAWCGKILGEDPRISKPSHGICKECSEREMAEFRSTLLK